MAQIVCPNCQGDKIARKEMIYKSGTNVVGHERQSIGLFGIDGGWSVGSIGGSSSTHSTKLAQQCAPPAKESKRFNKFLIFLGIITVMFLAPQPANDWLKFAVLLLGILFIYLGIRSNKTIEKEFEEACGKWKKQWVCLKCGRVWIQE